MPRWIWWNLTVAAGGEVGLWAAHRPRGSAVLWLVLVTLAVLRQTLRRGGAQRRGWE